MPTTRSHAPAVWMVRREDVVFCLLLALPCLAWASTLTAAVDLATPDLTELTLTELAGLKITSVSKRAEERSKTAAAIYLITRDDIRRSGATSLPELLRLAPGVDVARIDSDHWSVGVRGFGDQFSKSVLVLIDGRSVYTPLLAGVYWGVQDTLLADIDRIEVIRGPGGTIWGANAVDGVINIITKAAADTHGPYASATGGTLDQAIGEFRYGGGDGTHFDYRGYGKGFSRGPEFHTDGANYDDWRAGQIGGRADWKLAHEDTLTVQGDAYKGADGQRISLAAFSPPAQRIVDQNLDVSGANLRARWRHKLKHAGDVQIQGYYDYTSLSGPQLHETRHTLDLDVTHRVSLPWRQEVVWGLGARTSPSTFDPTVPTLDFQPRAHNMSIYSAFVQDEIAPIPDTLALTLGAKLEHNSYTGFELQPSARLWWTVAPGHTLWAAASRAVRTPSRVERDFRLSALLSVAPLAFLEIDGSPQFESERLIGYEAGYRALVTPRLYVDVAAFHNQHDNLASFAGGNVTVDLTPAPPHATLHFAYANGITGTTQGFEIAPDWRPTSWWQLRASYSYLTFDLRNKPGNNDTSAVATDEGSSPRHQVLVRSLLELPKGFELDQTYRYVSALPARKVEAYHSADLRLGWRWAHGLALSLVGQNLLQPRHAEFGHDPPPTVWIRRAAYVQLTWQP